MQFALYLRLRQQVITMELGEVERLLSPTLRGTPFGDYLTQRRRSLITERREVERVLGLPQTKPVDDDTVPA